MTIEPDGDLDVTETIRLVSLAQQINHGIQRDFPTSYTNPAGQHTHVGFEVVSVRRDGHDEPWTLIGLSNGERVRIGSAEVNLPPGQHTYVIRYRTTRQLVLGEDHDELYWNVTGNGWTFPIDVARASITLPSPATFGNRAVHTGPQGSTAHDAEVVEERPGFISFMSTSPLGRYEGLTVAAAFPKGVIAAPDTRQRTVWWLEDWGALATAIATSLGMIVYYLRAWWIAGRGPRAGTIVPIFSPPDDLSPAAVRYISRMGFDNRAFSSAIVFLGVRGKLRIKQEEGGWLSRGKTTLSRVDSRGLSDDGSLPAPERSMWTTLFLGVQSIELKQENHSTLQSARSALENGLAAAYEGAMFRKNTSWATHGLLLLILSMLAIAAVALMTSSSSSLLSSTRFDLPPLAVACWIGAMIVRAYTKRKKGMSSIISWGLIVILGIIGVSAAIGTIGMAISIGTLSLFVPLLLLPVAISAFWWMYALTPEGRAVMDRIAGFRQYLSITEEHRLDEMHPPEKTPELFERYLPYAIALDVENRWAEAFAGVLAAAAAAGASTYTGGWYSGYGNVWDDPQGFANDIGSSLTSTVSSAATSPSSSGGGSGGGGSSGGGGGGGGGSGW